jgi:hypothetical protein
MGCGGSGLQLTAGEQFGRCVFLLVFFGGLISLLLWMGSHTPGF